MSLSPDVRGGGGGGGGIGANTARRREGVVRSREREAGAERTGEMEWETGKRKDIAGANKIKHLRKITEDWDEKSTRSQVEGKILYK